ncbi:MAG: 4a-hydroxytetrahydrobiopterin dehydratase [Nodosilinea sp.]
MSGRTLRGFRFSLAVGALSLGALLLRSGALPTAAPPDHPALPSGWSQAGDRLVTVCQFADFAATVAFVERLVEPSDRLGHHPDLAIAYNRLTINLTTHDAGGVTSLDFALAQAIAALHEGQCQRPSPPVAR